MAKRIEKKLKNSIIDDLSRDEKLIKLFSLKSTWPSNNAADSIAALNSKVRLSESGAAGMDSKEIEKSLGILNENLRNGSMHHVESMLLDQAHMLQAMSTYFIRRLSNAEYLPQVETYSRIALKAQNQCRQTLATLGELKNPKRATFIKQQNNAVNQQINQGDLKQTENSKKPDNSANKLLKEVPSERLDFGAPQEAVRGNQEVEAVGAVDRSKNGRREGQG